MIFKQFGNKYVISLNKGDEILQSIKQFCIEQNITLGSISGIGATNDVTVGLFETASKTYHSKQLTGDFEITSLTGNITTMNQEVYLHVHITLATPDYKVYGGHLSSALISGAGEFIIEAIDGTIERAFNNDIGLNILKY